MGNVAALLFRFYLVHHHLDSVLNLTRHFYLNTYCAGPKEESVKRDGDVNDEIQTTDGAKRNIVENRID